MILLRPDKEIMDNQQDTSDSIPIPTDLLCRVAKYVDDHPDDEFISLESAEVLEPITIKHIVAEHCDIEVEWFPCG